MKKFYSLVAVAALSAFSVAQAQEVIYNETFDVYAGQGGNDSNPWSGTLQQPALADKGDGLDTKTGFTYVKGYEASKSVKVGTGGVQGSATTPKLDKLNGNAVLTFRAGAWSSANEQTTLVVEIIGGGTLSANQVTMVKGSFTEFTLNIVGGTPNSQIVFKGFQAASSRFFLDDVKVTTEKLGIADYSDASKSLKNTVWADSATFSSKENATVEIYNVNGQLVKTFEVKGEKAVNVSSLAKGIYIVKTTVNGTSTTSKVVKK
ncbi:T9SS type A sorting domain-containing protein [Empedobacter falsenii]|uniref:T9SS type A sorting domain-containing protein n=1 Tax=Empedobacter falsenii TaxID=343874 RepID=UPI001C58AD99|nr:T9SS type A sorting domain-containing protein [Empedobacter falsenii]MBW1617750.1 T9SS type A sorting domain-containing protein [Empedobacter falsenii]